MFTLRIACPIFGARTKGGNREAKAGGLMYAIHQFRPSMTIPDMTYRYVASAIVGVVLFLRYFQPFLPYSQRGSPNFWPFLIIVLISGFLLSLGLARRRFWVPTCLLLTLFAGNFILIVADSITDSFDRHNLLPFEFIFIALLTLPAYFGALIAATIDSFRARGMKA
jgi:hypothetical protein